MKVAVSCESPLLQRALEIFLAQNLSSSKKSDILITDKKFLEDKRRFYIASDSEADLQKPFSKSQLILALEKKYKTLHAKKQEQGIASFKNEKQLELLEAKITQLTQQYQHNIMQTIREFYEE